MYTKAEYVPIIVAISTVSQCSISTAQIILNTVTECRVPTLSLEKIQDFSGHP